MRYQMDIDCIKYLAFSVCSFSRFTWTIIEQQCLCEYGKALLKWIYY
jgi:hypothetical protein